MKVAFITSLPHSGSTLLDLLVSSHPEAIGLGEVGRVISTVKNDRSVLDRVPPCVCGERYDKCLFWGPVVTRLDRNPAVDPHAVIIEHARELWGEDCVLVDSSKRMRFLESLSRQVDDIRILSLVRDARSWTVSRLAVATTNEGQRVSTQPARAFAERTAGWQLIRWYRMNRVIDAGLEGVTLPILRIGYEPLALRTEVQMRRIFEFLDLPNCEIPADLTTASSHILFGNPMRKDPSTRSEVRYDMRWMTDRSWVKPYAVLPKVAPYNQREVYESSL